MTIEIITFGFKYGRPPCNHFFDVSWIPNPWRFPGKDPYELVISTPGALPMITAMATYLEVIHEKDRAIVGIGCSAGRDRSPIIAELVKEHLQQKKIPCAISHRDKER